jgi:hypothetical protein
MIGPMREHQGDVNGNQAKQANTGGERAEWPF